MHAVHTLHCMRLIVLALSSNSETIAGIFGCRAFSMYRDSAAARATAVVSSPPVLEEAMGVLQKSQKRGSYKQFWSDDDADAMLKDPQVVSGVFSMQMASDLYGIPKTSVFNRLKKHRAGEEAKDAGAPTTLSISDETALLSWAMYLARAGFPPTRGVLLDKAAEIAAARNVVFKTADGKPGLSWWRSFRRRWRQSFKMRVPARRSHKQNVPYEVYAHFFNLLEKTIKDNSIQPGMLFNMDESGVDRPGRRAPVLSAVDSKARPVTNAVDYKEHVTLVATVNAVGDRLNPFLIYKGASTLKPRLPLFDGIKRNQKGQLPQFAMFSSECVTCWRIVRSLLSACRKRLDDGQGFYRVFQVVRFASKADC